MDVLLASRTSWDLWKSSCDIDNAWLCWWRHTEWCTATTTQWVVVLWGWTGSMMLHTYLLLSPYSVDLFCSLLVYSSRKMQFISTLSQSQWISKVKDRCLKMVMYGRLHHNGCVLDTRQCNHCVSVIQGYVMTLIYNKPVFIKILHHFYGYS